jgi:hypothetical protein
MYLYDPINNQKTEINSKMFSGITGTTIESLRYYYKNRKLVKSLKCYVIDDDTTMGERRSLMEGYIPIDEIWLNIDAEGVYQCSNYGRVKRMVGYKKPRMMMPVLKNNKEWLRVKVIHNGKYKSMPVHRLVAELFVPNDKGFNYVIHKNGNKSDNFAGNLEWSSKSEVSRLGSMAKCIPVMKIDPKSGEVLDEYRSITEAGRLNYLSGEVIRSCVSGIGVTAGGCLWIGGNEDDVDFNMRVKEKIKNSIKIYGRIPVLKIDPRTDEVLGEYESIADACRKHFVHKETIRACVAGKYETAIGYKWIRK